jgi:hypothetical protein
MNAWGVIVIALGLGVMWWSVKHGGSLTSEVYGGNVDPLANQNGANPWAPFPDFSNLTKDL